MLAAIIFIISYSMYMYFLVIEIKRSQFINLTFSFYKLTIMTGNNVHFLILKNTKKFTNFWWLNLGTESDVSTVWIFYCDKNKCKNSNFNQKRMFTLKILISQKVALLSCFERIRVVQLDCHPAKVQLKQRISTLHPNQCDKNLNLLLIFHVSANKRTTQRLKYQTCIVMIEILFECQLTFKNTSLRKLEVLGFSLLYQVHMHT